MADPLPGDRLVLRLCEAVAVVAVAGLSALLIYLATADRYVTVTPRDLLVLAAPGLVPLTVVVLAELELAGRCPTRWRGLARLLTLITVILAIPFVFGWLVGWWD